jgi:hypothetical protein
MADRETEKRIYAARKARIAQYQKIVEEQLAWDEEEVKQFLTDLRRERQNTSNHMGATDDLDRVYKARQELTYKQELFVENFLRYRNGTRAATVAGYKDPDKASQVMLYFMPKVKQEIQRRLKLLEAKIEFNTDSIIRELANVAFSNLDDFLEIDAKGNPCVTLKWATREQLAALREIHNETILPSATGGEERPVIKKVQIKLHDKIRALEILAKLFNLYPEDKPQEGARMAGAIMAALREMKEVEAMGV